ncbi:MAG TPA: DNA polymerase III subunit delta [Chloroflexia bacterium]|nr:DNA polymerase III subunit delta [Chloroflexia bacterium]
MLITLIGPDRFLVGQALHSYIAKHAPEQGGGFGGAEGMGSLNLTRLDGARLAPDELARTAQSLGFFAETRVVVVEGLLSRFGGAKSSDEEGGANEAPAKKVETPGRGRGRSDPGLAESFAQLFGAIPDSTVLILVERGGVAKNNALLKAAARYGKVEEYLPPKGMALERWIKERAASMGVRVTPGAQAALAAGLPDLQTLAGELDKLSLYVGEGETIDEKVLREMSFVARQDDVFEMTSAAARRDTKGALQRLHYLVEGGTAPEGILPVLAWQVRTLIQVRDMLDRRVPEGRMAETAGLSDFIVRKSVGQARQFTMSKLLDIHHKLLELDHAVKTGRAEAEMTLDSLVVEMCR